MMQCSICKQFFNPAMLSEVFEHEHKEGLVTDKEYYGKEIKYIQLETGRLEKEHYNENETNELPTGLL
jgi:hypothetical protein